MNLYEEINIAGYERVVKCTNDITGLHSWIVVHNTSRGPSLGGCRMWNYATEKDALQDCLNLAKGMTYKSAISNLPLGGGKAVIWGDKRHKTRDLLLSMAEFVNYLDGKYIIAEDVGTTIDDMLIMQELGKANIVNCDCGDPGPYTAWGVVSGIKACLDFKHGSPDPTNRSFMIQGIGSVGNGVANHLSEDNVDLYISDINEEALLRVATETGATIVSNDEIYAKDVDVYVPCALGQTINEECLTTLKAPIIAGSANNQLAASEYGDHLFHKGILYAPDYVINAGGIILACEATRSDGNEQKIMEAISKIGPTLIEVFERSRDEKLPTNVIADRMAEERFKG